MKLTKNFSLYEFMCKDGTPVPEKYISNAQRLAKNLQVLRDKLGEPVHIHSSYRTPSHNKAVGGAKNSQHLLAKAADITVKSKSPRQLHELIELLIAAGEMHDGGLGLYPGFVHYDIRAQHTRWDET